MPSRQLNCFLATLSLLLINSWQAMAQVGIGTTTPDTSAALDVSATGKGILVPRMTQANRPSSPVTGLMIYQTDGAKGFYYYDGTAWKKTSTTAADTLTQNLYTNSYKIAGDAAYGLQMGSNGLLISSGVYGSGTDLPDPSQSEAHMIWYPKKAAFRAGQVSSTQWNDPNIGSYSVAMGQDARASGTNTIAIGYQATAANTGSIALGEGTYASGSNSVALGYGASTYTTAGSARSGVFSFADRSVTLNYYSNATLNDSRFQIQVNNSFNTRCSGGYYMWTNSGTSTGLRLSTLSSTSNEYGSFVWTDRSSDAGITPAIQNQTIFRSSGGFTIYSNSGTTSGVSLAAGGGSWTSLSDRRKKEHFRPIDCERILQQVAALPLSNWNYKSQPATQRHIGPMAQDFYAAFHLDGIGNDTTINTVDIDGVNMAAIQALESRTRTLQQENDDLRKRLAQLEQIVGGTMTSSAAGSAVSARASRKK